MGLNKESGIALGKWPKGERNLITDVPGVKVGHVTLNDGDIKTGVTAIIPHEGDLFHDKLMAGVSVINGFGKSVGLVQIDELGTLESPIIMTNTLSVGTALTASVKYMLEKNPDIGVETGTVNCVVTECNDGSLNDIRGLHVKEEHVFEALANASDIFEEGVVGSGTGMTCLGVKGGIGSASRVVKMDGVDYTVGSIVMSNFGQDDNLRIGDNFLGPQIDAYIKSQEPKKDKGSIIIVIATDAPLSDRQLRRVAKRAMISLGRVGSYSGNGSGDIAIAFSTGNHLPHYSDKYILDVKMAHDDLLDELFEASVEATEEAIISSLYHADTTHGIRGKVKYGLKQFL
ncbi:MAG: P1 family peptidase [Firmicutes bacterium]|nr:P1 family peptidase [Bacillota bacterium]